MRPLKPYRSQHLSIPSTGTVTGTGAALLRRAEVDDLLEPFEGVRGAQLGRGERKVVFDVEAGGPVQDRVVDSFGVVRRGDGEDAFVPGLQW